MSTPGGLLSNTQTKRLYISPLDSSLFASTILPKLARKPESISFHTIPVFPEKGYGYLDLLSDDSKSLRKSLAGSILRGMKVRVEDARPDKKRKARELERSSLAPQYVRSSDYPSKKHKKKGKSSEPGVLSGVELPEGRLVKRGWQDSSISIDSKDEGQGTRKNAKREVVFRTKVPPNRSSNFQSTHRPKKDGRKKASTGHSGDQVTIKEFSNQSKFMTFLRGNSVEKASKTVTVFEEGTGWLDEDGSVVDNAVMSRRLKRVPTAATTSSGSDSGLSSSSSLNNQSSTVSSDSESESDAEQGSDSDSGSRDSKTSESAAPLHPPQLQQERKDDTIFPDSAPKSKLNQLSVQNFVALESTPKKAVHPLEALFKRPSHRSEASDQTSKTSKISHVPAPIDTGFRFFGAANDDLGDAEEEVDEATRAQVLPQTPFTRRDLEGRAIRSAAPTPDTAAIGGRFAVNWPRPGTHKEESFRDDSPSLLNPDTASISSNDAGGDGSLGGEMTPISSKSRSQDESQRKPTEFEASFWERRGEFNRSWKERKHSARKEIRRRENRHSARIDPRKRR